MRLLRKPVTWIVLAVVGSAVAVGLYLFAPWKLWIDERVDEALPEVPGVRVTTATSGAATATSGAATGPQTPDTRESTATPQAPESTAPATRRAEPSRTPPAPENRELARGQLISHEHSTSGTARLIQLATGERVLTLEMLDTSNGPDLEVWLTDAPVIEGGDGWHVFDDGRYVDLGDLKGNLGNQVYTVPRDADLSALTSVSIWCDRFNVSFGAAELIPI